MEDFDVLCRAKMYIDKLANGINPLDNQPLKEDDVVNNVRLSRCFFYVADVLRQVIENGGAVQRRKKRLVAFSISDEDLSRFEYSEEPIALTHIVARFNSLINQKEMKKLSYKVILSKLKEMGLIEDANGRYSSTRTCPTEIGTEMGISIEKRISCRGEYYATYYNRNAQEFIVNHIQAMIGETTEETE